MSQVTSPIILDSTGQDIVTELAAIVTAIGRGRSILTPASPIAIPSAGSSASYNMAGLSADHVVIKWNFSLNSTEISENFPPADISITTYDGYFTIAVSAGTTSATCQPVFANPSDVSTSIHT